ncbi:MAG TPA: hypothetical protein PLT09_09705 [Deltaproteobacteria bacterium]|nr:hypothetical protein [Deltaproteobacteria bacterium]HPR55825.1 hypothetical protein [Deltaproteobacteria bacterium]HXK47706.1 hypothetical protein [Deltaproteobacteria bacterium]
MGLDDLFKHRHSDRHSHHSHGRHDHDDHAYEHDEYPYYRGNHHGRHKLDTIRSIYDSLPHKRALLAGAAILVVLVLLIGIAVLWALFPLIIRAAEYVEVNGIKGLVDAVLPFIQKLWEGSGA